MSRLMSVITAFGKKGVEEHANEFVEHFSLTSDIISYQYT
jgi:hypothetical protein